MKNSKAAATGKPDATDEEVMGAAEKAQCGEFLARLAKGIHTMAGDGGKQLFGGERQRISLARAILKNAPLWYRMRRRPLWIRRMKRRCP